MTTTINVGMKCIKYMLFVANFMFVMVGVLLISFGSTIKSIYNDFELFMEDHYFSPAGLVIAVGVIILLIAVFGCVAAIKESTCMVNVFGVLLSIALILELSAAIAAYSMRGDIKHLIGEKMTDAMHNYQNDTEAKNAVDFLQERLACCGVFENQEWSNILEHPAHGLHYVNGTYLPSSCCRNFDQTDEICLLYEHGCLDRLTYIVSESAIMLGTGALCIAFVQVLGIGFAFMLAKSIRRVKTQEAAARWQTRQELYLQLARGAEKPSNTPAVYNTEENRQNDS